MKNKSIILALETTIGEGSISIFKGCRELGFRVGRSKISKASVLLYEVSELLRENNLSKSEIDLIAVSDGSGSLTGQRIGWAFAKGLARSIRCEICSVSLLKALSKPFTEAEKTRVFVSNGEKAFCYQDFKRVRGSLDISEISRSKVCKLENFKDVFENDFDKNIFDLGLYKKLNNGFASINEKEETTIILDKTLSFYIGKGCND